MEETSCQSFLREEAALRLWNLWNLGHRPDLNAFVAQAGLLSDVQLVAVLRVDQAQRWRAGERVPVESYLMRFPHAITHTLDLIYGECLVREELGEKLSLAEYQQRFPQFSESVTAIGATVSQPPAAAEASTRGSGSTTKPLPRLPNLPGFEILEMVGGGGMGVVYKARQLTPDRVVALKIIRPEQQEQVSALRRFEREVRAAMRLDHPNIVRFHAADQIDGQHFFVMEYVSGVDLQNLVSKAGPLPPHRSADFIRQAALALQHAHERSMVHRDIKPANMMVTSSAASKKEQANAELTQSELLARYVTPAGMLVKVFDMGLARVIAAGEQEDSWSTMTVAGTFMGTPDYMAPEQWENPHATDIRTDIYSLGCSLYFLLTGQPPFPGGTMIQKLDKHRSQIPTPAEQLRPAVTGQLSAVVNKMLAKRPAQRFQTPGEVAAALAALPTSGSSSSITLPSTRLQPPGEVSQFLGHKDAINAIAVSPDGKLLASSGQDGTLRVWEIARTKEQRQLVGHTGAVRCVTFSPDGQHILSGGQDRNATLWQASTGKSIRSFGSKHHRDAVKCVAFSGDGKHAITGSSDRTVRVWEVSSGRRIVKCEGHSGDISCVLFSPDNQRIFSSSWDKSARLWDAKSGKALQCFGGAFSSLQWLVILGMSISPDGQRLAVGGSDNLLRLWDPLDGRELGQYPGHTDWITTVAFSPDGRRLLTGSRDQSVRLWDADTGRECHCFRGHTQQVTCVVFSPDGRFAFSAGADGTIRHWRLPP